MKYFSLLPDLANINIITNVAFCENVFIPQRGFVITDCFLREHCHFLAEAGKKIYQPDNSIGNVWLSRRAIHHLKVRFY